MLNGNGHGHGLGSDPGSDDTVRAAAGVLLAASLTIGFVPSLVTKSVNPVAAGVTTYSQHNTKAPAKAAPAKAAQPAQR